MLVFLKFTVNSLLLLVSSFFVCCFPATSTRRIRTIFKAKCLHHIFARKVSLEPVSRVQISLRSTKTPMSSYPQTPIFLTNSLFETRNLLKRNLLTSFMDTTQDKLLLRMRHYALFDKILFSLL